MDVLHLIVLQRNHTQHTLCTSQQGNGQVAIVYMYNKGIFVNILSKFFNYSTHHLQKLPLRPYVGVCYKLLKVGCTIRWLLWLKYKGPAALPMEYWSPLVHEILSVTLLIEKLENQICKLWISLVEAVLGDVNMMNHLLAHLH